MMINLQQLLDETWLEDVEHYSELASTQDRARALAVDPAAKLPALVVADNQTAGRGRGANRWWTGSGSLAFSLAFSPFSAAGRVTNVPQVSLAAAVVLVDTIQQCAGGLLAGLHWPNDVFVGNRKLAGILVDVIGAGRHVLGVGINTNNTLAGAPAEVQERAAALADLTGSTIDHTEFLTVYLQGLREALDELEQKPEQFGRRFDELCLQHGEVLTLRTGTETVQGVCEGIAGDGALLLATQTGRRRFYSGTLR